MEEELKKTLFTSVALAGAAALLLSSCASGGDNAGGESGGSGGGAVTVGTTETVTSLDPAGAYDNGSFGVMTNVYPFLLNNPVGESTVSPDIAESAEFTAPTEYTVKLKPGLTFANGNELTSSDVKFTFDRQVAIADPNGPSSLLANLDSIETPDDTTIVFKLKSENDQTFPQVLSSPVGPIVDEDVFPADAILDDQELVKANPFAGPYAVTNYDKGNLIAYQAFDGYEGLWGAPKTDSINVKYFANESNLSQAIETKAVDVAFRNISATDVEKFEGTDGLNVVKGPGGEIRYIVFNFNTQPFGTGVDGADPAKALAVRQAVADSLDREKISTEVFKGTYTPLYSYIPEGLLGANESLKGLYGDGDGGPDAERAAKRLSDAGVETPVNLKLQYAGERYGAASAEEYAQIKSQLEADGLFTVDLQSTEWGQYTEDRVKDLYPAHQLGWFPDYSDPDNYLTPFFSPDNFLVNHYENADVVKLIDQQRVTGDEAERGKLLEQAQDKLAEDLSTLPMQQGAQVAVAVDGVDGVTLDASFKFRFGSLTK
ncbi:Periplasmic dipeptide transport protein [Leucobacter aridicollis]|uniref:Peptide/nickel transport system substrate-binding protein n=1 Tax=Leucobacter aridicollis TaxID=283878 RepID=A0A852R6E0_9MICO|nr:ABC transporter substrate-binding protein [Leucobacter aridicollis]MBL3682600.1 peptide ABC transporter substrate-binding protein [Leucobacter aridicollis]MCS3426795.1 peptide/nickel transport system substrate-binding protein [Leucobacter aridicollis]NYD26019.1 peptide/nickel transport system substrate-binding protein [Leucobacter aridicollis]RKQ89141.1 peptide/nickel transport system substrate-binding protein [Mycolicibacterium mucogenicum 261Sha1.1M5]